MSAEIHFDELIHAPNRLRICALLAAAGAVEFATVREALEVSDSVLSKHLSVLGAAGYIRTTPGAGLSRRRLWVALTAAGRRAYDAHVRAMQQIVRPEALSDPHGEPRSR